MDLSFKSLIEWSKLTIRNPRLASELIKEAKLPLEVSIIMIVLAGVVSGFTFGVFAYAFELMVAGMELPEDQVMPPSQSPIMQGVLSSIQGIVFALAVFRIGGAMGGQGSNTDIMAVTALVQIVAAMLFLLVALLFFVFPVGGAILALFNIFIFLRGLGHAVQVGHSFETMGQAAGAIMLSFIAVLVIVSVMATLLGLGG